MPQKIIDIFFRVRICNEVRETLHWINLEEAGSISRLEGNREATKFTLIEENEMVGLPAPEEWAPHLSAPLPVRMVLSRSSQRLHTCY